MNRRTALGLCVALGCILGATGCGRDGDTARRTEDAAVQSEPPVLPPEGLLAEVRAGTPNDLWQRVRTGVGGALGLFPNELGGLVCSAAGLDADFATRIDGGAPTYAVLAKGGDGVAFVAAFRLKDLAAAEATLVDGENARFDAKEVSGLRVLVGKTGGRLPAAVGFAKAGYLLVATTEEDLVRLGPYAARTLPGKPVVDPAAITIDVPHGALAGPLRAEAGLGWGTLKSMLLQKDAEMRAKHGGRAPDFGDATAIVARLQTFVDGRLALMGDLERIHVAVDAGDDDIHAAITFDPVAGTGGPAHAALDAMRPGDTAPLLAAPKDAVLSILTRDDASIREGGARDVESALTDILGARLTEADGKRLHGVLDGWSKGRGNWLAVSLLGGAERAVSVRTPATDKEVLSRSVREGIELTGRPGFKEPFGHFFGVRDPVWGAADVSGLGKATVVTWKPGAQRAGSSAGGGLDAAWLVGDAGLDLAIAATTAGSSTALRWIGSAPEGRLGDDPHVARALAAGEANTTFALVAQPLKLDAVRTQTAAAPLVFLWGRRGDEGWARVEVSDLLLRDLFRTVGRF